jgi:hypothetical protein
MSSDAARLVSNTKTANEQDACGAIVPLETVSRAEAPSPVLARITVRERDGRSLEAQASTIASRLRRLGSVAIGRGAKCLAHSVGARVAAFIDDDEFAARPALVHLPRHVDR